MSWVLALGLALAAAEEKSPAVVPPGQESIFNGANLDGWVPEGIRTVFAPPEARPVWKVEDGKLVCEGWGYGFLRYDVMLEDFKFHVEYRMTEGCNSGVGIRGVKFRGPKQTRPSFAGYEIQILDDAGKTPNKHSSGSLYRYVAPTSNPVKPAGEWNTMDIECFGPKIRIAINGEVVQDVDQSQIPEIADKPLKGYLSLQNHGHTIEFRNLGLEKL